MYKKMKTIIIVALLLTVTTFLVNAVASNNVNLTINDSSTNKTNFDYIEDKMLNSSKYTQNITYSNEKIDDYLNNYTVKYNDEKLAELNYERVLSNDNFTLYFENDSFSVVLINNKTGFVWSSRAEHQQMTDGNNNARFQMNSGIWIDYIRTTVNPFIQTTVPLYSAAKVEFRPETEVSSELRPYLIKEGSYKKNLVEVTSKIDEPKKKITSFINYKDLKISFEVELTLTSDGINVYVNNETVKEGNEIIRLTNIYVFPFLGSAKEDKTPGYFLIPDEVGALVRFNKEGGRDYNAKFYGNDFAANEGFIPNMTLPVFGIVHHENNNAMYGHITKGAENVLLQGRNWGKNTKYFRLNPRYTVRQTFKTIIDRGGNGYDSVIEEISKGELSVDYYFLTEKQASYVGIGNHYQQILFGNGILSKKESSSGSIPLSTNYLMADREKTFLGHKNIMMSTAKEITSMYDYLKFNKIDNQVLTLSGYSTSGSARATPHKFKYVDSKKNINNMIEHVKLDNNQVYLENSYVFSSSVNNRVTYNSDVARDLSELRMKYQRIDINGNLYDIYYLYPEVSLAYIKNDKMKINELNASGFSLLNDSHRLYSTTKGNKVNNRTANLETNLELLEVANGSLLSTPNEYALKYASGYTNLVLGNSQFDFYTDLVPFVPIVLKGYLDYYSTYLNFNALGKEKILMMIDFAVNPNYILTYEDTFKMRRTMSSYLYSTSFNDYKDEVVEVYNYMNNALKHVRGESITAREVLDAGIVKVTYSNDVVIYVNYSSHNYTNGNITVLANDYKVVS